MLLLLLLSLLRKSGLISEKVVVAVLVFKRFSPASVVAVVVVAGLGEIG